MNTRQWMRSKEALFRSVNFEKLVGVYLEAVHSATTRRDRHAAAGQFGGFLRRLRAEIRLSLTRDLLDELAIEPTQHVAFYVMSTAFSLTARTADLDKFAKPGRDASEKHMHAARHAVFSQPQTVRRYGVLYEWYCKRLAFHLARIKNSSSI
jgi:hypothetical protein